jgi:quercetin dioxygenase-like cupin family protein
MSRKTHTSKDRAEIREALSRRSLLEQSLGVAVTGTIFGTLFDRVEAEAQSASEAGRPQTIRVVIAGNNPEGKSHIVSDKRVPIPAIPAWRTDPEKPIGEVKPGDSQKIFTGEAIDTYNIDIPVGASRVNIVSPAASKPGAPLGWHRTRTVDVSYMIHGECEWNWDLDKTTIKAGDLVVERNTNHARVANAPYIYLVFLVGVLKQA